MNLKQLDIRDQRVQQFLWEHIEPTDVRWDYTKLDAMKLLEVQVYDGTVQLWGDLDLGFVFKATQRNLKVLEPHIMGNGVYLRSAMKQGVAIAWGLGYEKLAIWTQHEKIVRIATKCGFSLEARIPKIHEGPRGELLDLYVLTREKD
jgi:hypothetical protein